MTASVDPARDLTMSRVIKAPRPVVWSAMHEEMGFFDGWGTVWEQLARLVEQRVR